VVLPPAARPPPTVSPRPPLLSSAAKPPALRPTWRWRGAAVLSPFKSASPGTFDFAVAQELEQEGAELRLVEEVAVMDVPCAMCV